MDPEGLHRLLRLNDYSDEATGFRLAAALRVIGMSPTDFARSANQQPQAVFNIIAGRAFPNREILRTLLRRHRIDPAYIMFGEYSNLPYETQMRMFDALQYLSNERDRQSGSG